MKKLMMMTCAAALTAGVFADEIGEVERHWTPVDVGFCSILKVPPFDRDVYGLKLNILHSYELNVYGLDVGFIGCNKGGEAGLQCNGFNWGDGCVYGLQLGGVGSYVIDNVYGVQIGGLISWNLGETYGLQISTLNFDTAVYGLEIGALNWNYGAMHGTQLGVVNVEKHDITGAMVGALNFCRGDFTGGQIGVFNYANGRNCRGFQFGVINAATQLYGVQIGVVNINIHGRLPIMVVANANF